MSLGRYHELADQAAGYLIQKYGPSGRRIGWMMIASIFTEARDLYSISFLLVFLTQEFHPSPLLLGLASAGTQAGAIIGSLAGGWLVDKLGRRLHVHHGVHAGWQARGDGQSLAGDVRHW